MFSQFSIHTTRLCNRKHTLVRIVKKVKNLKYANCLSFMKKDFSTSDEYFVPDNEREPWKSLLELPARAAWRVSPYRMPEPLAEAFRNTLTKGGRTNKELRRTYEDIIAKHQMLADKRDRERIRVLKDMEYKPREQKKDSAIQPVLYGPSEALAAANFRMFANFSIIRRVLQESNSLLGSGYFRPKHVLDFGIGTGSASAAALNVWSDIEWIHGVDASQTMRECASTMLSKLAQDEESQSSLRVTLSAHLSSELASPAFDLALFAYTATELPHNAATLAAAAVLWEKLKPGGLFVMVEPGTPDGFSSVRMVRGMLLDCSPPGKEEDGNDECHTIAPCTHNGKCPMERFDGAPTRKKQQIDVTDANDEKDENEADASDIDDADDMKTKKGFCSFVQTMPSLGGKSKGEKFSYFVAQKRVAGQSTKDDSSFSTVDVVSHLKKSQMVETEEEYKQTLLSALELESRYIDSDEDSLGLEFLRGDKNRMSHARVIHAPRKNRGHILIDCCASPGRIVRHKISKSMSKRSPGLYTAARKCRWGGFWPNIGETETPFD